MSTALAGHDGGGNSLDLLPALKLEPELQGLQGKQKRELKP